VTTEDVIGVAPKIVGIVTHPQRHDAATIAGELERRLGDAGVEIRRWRDGDDVAAFNDGLDLAVSLGGDGTMLRTVDLVFASGAAVLGVHVGHLGYLTEAEPDDIDEVLGRLLDGDFHVTERMLLQIVVESSGSARGRWSALNEAVIEKLTPGGTVRLGVDINGTFFTTYAADGVIVATPTGSTAYSFSAGGPVVSPRARALVFTPVAAHMVFDRSIVVGGDEVVSVRVLERSGRVLMTVDGSPRAVLDPGDWVAVYQQAWDVRLLRMGGSDFFGRLKDRFALADSQAALSDGALPPVYRPAAPPPADLAGAFLPPVEPGPAAGA
jgi:NAD+ kinase